MCNLVPRVSLERGRDPGNEVGLCVVFIVEYELRYW